MHLYFLVFSWGHLNLAVFISIAGLVSMVVTFIYLPPLVVIAMLVGRYLANVPVVWILRVNALTVPRANQQKEKQARHAINAMPVFMRQIRVQHLAVRAQPVILLQVRVQYLVVRAKPDYSTVLQSPEHLAAAQPQLNVPSEAIALLLLFLRLFALPAFTAALRSSLRLHALGHATLVVGVAKARILHYAAISVR